MINLIPYPNSIKYLSGHTVYCTEENIEYIKVSTCGKEGYKLIIENDKIIINYSTNAGKIYALNTLRQMCDLCDNNLDNVIIEDEPRFSYRGFMLDCGRHSFDVEKIKNLLSVMSYFKLNVFHWHLTEDQGYRIESEKYPLLNSVGSRRDCSRFGRKLVDKEYFSYFTKEEIKEVVAYAKELAIEVIPEIDMPGHMTAALAAYPQFSCVGKDIKVETTQGIHKEILCVGNDDALQFVKDMLDEILPLFDSEYVHIGGDEAPKTRWRNCDKCTKRMQEEGLDSYEQLQGWFTLKIADYLKSKGKKVIVWNDSLKSNMLNDSGIIVQRWMDKHKLTKEYMQMGGEVIESEFFAYYADYPYGMTPLKKTYKYDPYSKLAGDMPLKGIEMPLWTEYIDSYERLGHMLFPRLIAFAERGWTNSQHCDYNRIKKAILNYDAYLKRYGIIAAPQKDWDKNPLARLIETASFHLKRLTLAQIKGSIQNNKKS